VPTQTETVDFGGLEIAFDDRLLRPRSWTTAQSMWAASVLTQVDAGPVLELCAGAGHIGLLAVAGSDRPLVCVDINPVATAYIHRNAEAAGIPDRVEVREGPMSEVLRPDERFPVVIADPPWVPRDQTSRFPEDPLLAIDGGDDGMDVVRECVRAIGRHLAAGGVAVLQLGTAAQATAVSRSFEDLGLVPGEVREYGDRGVLLRIDRS
jgi:methylase of polypeptide subunit release factors